MKQSLDKKLVEKYPAIFADRNGDMRETAMCWGFECDDGWYKIIDKLCQEIMWNCGRIIPVATQVKEKYGELCFYINGGSDEVYEAIRKAEKKSLRTCEICGEKGQLRENKGWFKTVCEKHRKEKDVLEEKEETSIHN
jgi:hypothetical protein